MERAYASEISLSQELVIRDEMKSGYEAHLESQWTQIEKLYDELVELSEKVPDDPTKGSELPTSQAPGPNPPKD